MWSKFIKSLQHHDQHFLNVGEVSCYQATELVEREHLVHLRGSVGLGFLDVLLLGVGLRAHDHAAAVGYFLSLGSSLNLMYEVCNTHM